MADLFPSLATLILPRIGQFPSSDGGLRGWLVSGTYRPNESSCARKIQLEGIATTEIVNAISFDYERFCLSSWESFLVSKLESESHKLIGWPLLKLYYSAFFAAHAIMRATGEGIVKLEKRQVQTINEVVQIVTGTSPDLKAGMYCFQLLSNSSGKITLDLSPHITGAGVHEGFWTVFADYLEKAAMKITESSLPEASAFIAGLSEIKPMLNNDAAIQGVWYSSVRNEINYQHKYGIWFPVVDSRSNNSMIGSIRKQSSSSVRLDFKKSDNPIKSFLNLSIFLASLNWEIADYVAARSTKPRAFGSNWRRFSKLIEAA